ncbi:MAG: hypothetical protein LBT06_10755 [Hungatella sp.]|jgi:hypothetical protein|nr:hypothetical protein [Hungatella sp.]
MAGINLRPHQFEALGKMKNGCILNGGVGSGKSRTGLAYYYAVEGGKVGTKDYVKLKKEKPRDLYIITTARKRDTLEWDKELMPFQLSVHPDVNLYKNKVVIDSWNNIKKYEHVKDAFFIFDEDRVVGSGAWVRAFLKISKSNLWILLSATAGDTWSDYIPVFIANGFYKNRTEFQEDHIVYKRFSKFPQIDRYLNTGRLVRLRNNILIPMEDKRHTVTWDEDIWCSYDQFNYKLLYQKRWNPWKEQPIENASELCYALRKLVNSDPSRQNAILELYEKHPKMIIFYNFDYELDILKGLYFGDGVEVAEWNGHKHQPVPDSNRWVYLVQYNAGAEGWNCIQTDTIVFFSQNYSYKIMAQSSGRINRLNTPFIDLYYYHLKSKSKIDLAIAEALRNKKKFNETGWVRKAV